MKTLIQAKSKRRGAALVEYGLIIAGVALVSAAAVSIFGKKTSDMIGSAAAVLPGANANDNGAIRTGRLIETSNQNGQIELDVQTIGDGGDRFTNNLGFDATELVIDGSSNGNQP